MLPDQVIAFTLLLALHALAFEALAAFGATLHALMAAVGLSGIRRSAIRLTISRTGDALLLGSSKLAAARRRTA